MLVVEREILPPQLREGDFYACYLTNKFITHPCYSWMQWFGSIHHPDQLDDTEADVSWVRQAGGWSEAGVS